MGGFASRGGLFLNAPLKRNSCTSPEIDKSQVQHAVNTLPLKDIQAPLNPIETDDQQKQVFIEPKAKDEPLDHS